jgi:hypothetical protein
MNSWIEAHSTQSGHIQGTTNVFSATPDVGLAGVTPGAEIIRGNTDQGSNLLTVELAEFRQLGQQNSAGLRADAFNTLQDFVFLAEVVIGLNVLLDDFVEFSDLTVKGFEHSLDAFANSGMSNGFTPIQFLGAQVNELTAATDQIGQFVRFGAKLRFGLRLNDLSEAGKDACIDGVSLGEFADSACEVTDLAWRDDNDLEVRLEQSGDNGTFISAGCFKHDQCDTMQLKEIEEVVDARGRIGQRNADGGGTRGDVKCVFGNVDADE